MLRGMSAASIAQAANDLQLQSRVLAMAQKEMVFNEALADTEYGKMLASISPPVALPPGMMPQNAGVLIKLMWPVAVDTEAAYESALLSGKGSPGHDPDVITDAALTSAIIAHWPYTDEEQPPPPEADTAKAKK